MSTLRSLTVSAALRAGAVLAGVAAAGAAWGASGAVGLTAAEASGGSLSVEGSLGGVRAGAPSAPMRLTLRNAGPAPRAVTRVSTAVSSARAGCPARHLAVGDWAGHLTVPARGSATVTVPVALDADLPARCRDVTWGLVYTAY